MKKVRILLVGGVISYRALFDWLSPWILVPSFLVTPLAQILLFAYIGRGAGVESDGFFLIGNALQYSAIPCLFGVTNIVVAERLQHTLALLFASPASRLVLFLGRCLPVLVNGIVVSAVSLIVGSAVLRVSVPVDVMGPLALAILAADIGAVGLGLACAAVGLRSRDTAVLANVLFGIILVFSGANVPAQAMPAWMVRVGEWLPLTHSIDAARRVAAGSSLGDVHALLMTEAALGIAYGLLGTVLLRLFEQGSRRAATLDLN